MDRNDLACLKQSMESKDTQELLMIWSSNNIIEWKEEVFDIVK